MSTAYTLCVITRHGKLVARVKKFLEGLSHPDFKLKSFVYDLAETTLEGVPQGNLYLLCDINKVWVSRVAQDLRKFPNPMVASSAIIWLSPDDNEQSRWTDQNLDDVILLNESTSHLSDRLIIRLMQARERCIVAQRALENAKNEIILKQREEFLGVCAHDLRSPIGLIRASLHMALEAPQLLSELQCELLKRSERQSIHALSLIEDLLDVMSYEQGFRPQFEVVNLGDFLNEFCKDYKLHADEKGLVFEYENTVPQWDILVDPERIRQLLQNIFTNSVKFTAPGKKIVLRAEPFYGRRRSDPPHPMAVVTLKDEGIGIPGKNMAEIFSRFSQIKGMGHAQGRGLGLTVAKQIAQLHDGNVWVSSREGEGSSFFTLFPYVLNPSRSKASLNRKKILIAHPLTENQMELIDPAGIGEEQIVFARNGLEAVTLAAHWNPDYIFFSPQLDKLPAAQAATILKKRQSAKRLLLANSLGEPFDHCIFDGVASIPITSNALNTKA